MKKKYSILDNLNNIDECGCGMDSGAYESPMLNDDYDQDQDYQDEDYDDDLENMVRRVVGEKDLSKESFSDIVQSVTKEIIPESAEEPLDESAEETLTESTQCESLDESTKAYFNHKKTINRKNKEAFDKVRTAKLSEILDSIEPDGEIKETENFTSGTGEAWDNMNDRGSMIELKYDTKPSKAFSERFEKAIRGEFSGTDVANTSEEWSNGGKGKKSVVADQMINRVKGYAKRYKEPVPQFFRHQGSVERGKEIVREPRFALESNKNNSSNMLKETIEVRNGFVNGKSVNLGDKSTDGSGYYLYGNMIAENRDGNLWITNGGYKTETIFEMLSALPNVNITIGDNGTWILNDELWEGDWTKVSVSENVVDEQKIKRLTFKSEFLNEDDLFSRIPNEFKVDGKIFEMSDGNNISRIKWVVESKLNIAKPVIIDSVNKLGVKEDLQEMKRLMNFSYKPQNGTVSQKGEEHIYNKILNKMRNEESHKTYIKGMINEKKEIK